MIFFFHTFASGAYICTSVNPTTEPLLESKGIATPEAEIIGAEIFATLLN